MLLPNKPTQSEAVLQARKKIQRELISWRQTQFVICPLLKPYIDAVDPSFPEKEKLMLPSSFDQHLREGLGLTSLAAVEYQLREGQAYDALEDVREKIKIFNANLNFKKANVFGQRANTRAQQFLSQLAADKVSGAEKYRVAHRALIRLGLSESDAHNDQLYGKDASRPARLGDSKKEDPWFWTVGRPSGLTPKEQTDWSLECESSISAICLGTNIPFLTVDRVKYFRDRSALQRAREEKEILECEMARTARSFAVMKEAWSENGRQEKEKSAFASSAYSFKQAKIYASLAEDAKVIQEKAEKKRLIYQQWYHRFALCHFNQSTHFLSHRFGTLT